MDLNTYLFFDGQCEEAFRLYENVLGGKLAGQMRYADAPSAPPSFKGCNRVIHVSLRVGDRVLMGSDMPAGGLDPTPPEHQPEAYKTPRGFRANVSVDSPAEAERIYQALAEGGTIAMPIAETFFARRFGMLNDRFGTPWMITCLKPRECPEHEAEPFVISRTFDVSRDMLWKCCTDPERMRPWWGPKGVTIIASKMDLRPGGTYHYAMRTPDGKQMWGRLAYREITPPERLVFANAFSDEQGGLTRHPLSPSWPIEMLSTFSFVDNGGNTTFTVTWTPLSPTARARHVRRGARQHEGGLKRDDGAARGLSRGAVSAEAAH
jgi:uncharacterized glyoxalase superfamily protein PhnB/uncharacterized protein YndB with AHSA1/START domain